jgi:hypothetical protein
MVFEEKFLTLEFDNNNNWIYANWKGYQTVEGIKAGCNKMLEIVKTKGCEKILNDNTKVLGTFTATSEWAADYWFPQLINAGLKSFAWVYSPDVFGKFSIQKTIELSKDSPIQTFGNINEAKNWLNSVK